MSDLVAWLDDISSARALLQRERERCGVITARLRRFTQGHRAHVFDRQSTFNLESAVTAIGFRAFAMAYAADLTPALAVVLTAILSMLGGDGTRATVIVVDEAHRITSDPDAGEVLGQLVRQARKHAAGVWMCSQRVDDFIATDLGRTLAATASTKVLLGAEESSLPGIREVFGLDDEECSVLSPVQQGRGVLLSAGERAAVSILPGPAVLAVSDTTPTAVRIPAVVER
jgi:type IV secretory pathway VirB4 component